MHAICAFSIYSRVYQYMRSVYKTSYILREDEIWNTRERPCFQFVKLNFNHIVVLAHTHHIINEIENKHIQRTCLTYNAGCKES